MPAFAPPESVCDEDAEVVADETVDNDEDVDVEDVDAEDVDVEVVYRLWSLAWYTIVIGCPHI
ncbi:hypothetical protein N7507_004640 [Penicillium longicatenatum]|nr:hypothetical protein N7507_004640 [Penicillium longicatenatum]